MTQLYFRHSYVYESMLSRLDGMAYSDADAKDAWAKTAAFAEFWNAHNDAVFAEFKAMGFDFAEFWIAYFVRPRDNMVPFSDPLTVFLHEDHERTMAILVHELGHVLLTYPGNEELARRMMSAAPEESFAVRAEIAAALLSRAVLRKVLGADKTATLQAREREFPVLGDAWKVIDGSPAALAEPDPVKAAEALS